MLSAAASNAWWALTNEQRKLWKDKSKEAAKLHKINNPGYVFRPTKRQERKNPTKQTKRSKPCPQSSKSAKSDGDQTQRQQCGEVTDTSTVESAAHPQNVTENMEIEIQNMLAPVPALTNPALMDVDLTMPVWFPPQPGSGAVDPLDLSYISPSTSSSASSGVSMPLNRILVHSLTSQAYSMTTASFGITSPHQTTLIWNTRLRRVKMRCYF